MNNSGQLTYSEIVDGIRSLPLDAKSELRKLLKRELIEARRAEIAASHVETLAEYERGELKPTSDINELMKRLNAE